MPEYSNLSLFIVFGVVFGPLAGIMAFLITYEEYSHHHLPRRELLKASLQAACAGFVAILVLAVVVGYLLGKTIR
ncbi:MAG: hypothetical protein ACUVX1_17030 [Chloroflexota bacterium]